MSTSTQITPRKRKVATAAGQGEVNISPVVPYPTPSSRKRRAIASSPPPEAAPPKPVPPKQRLPDHIQTVLTLHHAFNTALSYHIAHHMPVLPPHSAHDTTILLPNLTNHFALRAAVERTSGRRFDVQALQRLAFVWAWDGQVPSETSESGAAGGKGKARAVLDDNPFLDSAGPKEVRGMTYLLTATRTLDSLTGRKQGTYGLGIELEIAPGETRQILVGGGEGGLGNRGQGGGVRAVARWNAGVEARHDEFRQRLEKWVALHGGYENEQADQAEAMGVPTPTTRSNERSTIPPIPLLPLPKLPSMVSAGSLFAATSASPGLSSLPRAKPASLAGPALADPFELKPTAEVKTSKGDSSIEARRQAMADRARQEASRATGTTLGSAVAGGMNGLTAVAQQEELKRRSTLSRLEDVAQAVFMMFSGPAAGSTSNATPSRVRRKAIQLDEVAEMIVKSSKTPISLAEAQTSLKLLAQLCPFFLIVKVVARQEWLEMPQAVAAPPSPGTIGPASPGKTVGALAGPASPGRVRRTGGLREVKERIRRELGE